MCLTTIDPPGKWKKTRGYGYKCMRLNPEGTYWGEYYGGPYEKGVTYTRNYNGMGCTESGPYVQYRLGFHIFREKKHAITVADWGLTVADWGPTVVRVRYSSATTFGTQNISSGIDAPTVVANKMTILGVVRK